MKQGQVIKLKNGKNPKGIKEPKKTTPIDMRESILNDMEELILTDKIFRRMAANALLLNYLYVNKVRK